MASRNGGPTCPKVEQLEELMEYVTSLKTDSPPSNQEESDHNDKMQETVEALDWLHTMLSNRKMYHAKRQAEQKIFMQTAKKFLGEDEIKAIQEQAERMINNG
jgi:hypothetical protein